jgi:hypothetical protein
MLTRKPRDPVESQLEDISRQGGALARLAHACAFLLILLFSAGSLVALSGDALVQVVRLGVQPSTIPPSISIAVSTLLVVAMDAGMLYAASMLRILASRRADPEERRIHVAVMLIASVLESCTYVYMAYRYDAPTNAAGWALVIARALAAPAFSIYLSMARALPVGPRDILYQVELASGKGVIRDAVIVANDTSAPLARKMALYGASATMTVSDRTRLDNMIGVLDMPDGGPGSGVPLPPPQLPPDDEDEQEQPTRAAETFPHLVPSRAARRPSASELRAQRKAAAEAGRRAAAFRYLDAHPASSANTLSKVLRCRRETAGQLYTEWQIARRQKVANA